MSATTDLAVVRSGRDRAARKVAERRGAGLDASEAERELRVCEAEVLAVERRLLGAAS